MSGGSDCIYSGKRPIATVKYLCPWYWFWKQSRLLLKFLEQAIESEGKYSQEVVAHSQAIQALDTVRKQVTAASEEQASLRQERDNALSALETNTAAWDEHKKRSDEEITKLNDRLKDLDEQNRVLHDTLQKLNDELAILQAKVLFLSEFK